MKTKEELTTIIQEMNDFSNEISELSDEELSFVTGGKAVSALSWLTPLKAKGGNGVVVVTGQNKNMPLRHARVRGTGSINHNDPLYIIDGVQGGSDGMPSPEDIENLNVLKDAASTSIYGNIFLPKNK